MSTNEKSEGSATTCVVGCKLPHGLHLELKNNDGEVVRFSVKGMNSVRIVGGYGLTDGIPTEFMERWLKKNAKHPAVIGQSIFMHRDGRSAESRAKEGRGIRTGIEPIHPLEDAKRFKIAVDKEAEKAYRQQVAENPVRERQIVE
jgi:hypothetical protein